MKKLLYTILIMGSFYSYAQNPVYGTYIKAIDSLDAAFIRVDDLTFDGSIISGTGDITLSSGTGVVRLSRTTDQLRFGTTNTTTINSVAPASSRTYIIPDAGTNTNFIMGAGANNISGSLAVDNISINGNTISNDVTTLSFTAVNDIFSFSNGDIRLVDKIDVDTLNNGSGTEMYFGGDNLNDIGSLTVDNLTLDASTISSQFATLRSNTPDAADNGQIAIAGGGAIGNGRGAYILLDGNESANDGLLSFVTGDDANALMTFRTGATVTPRLSINASGIFDFNSSTLADIGSLAVDQITLDGNDITTATNTDLTLAPNGTGILDVESNLSLSDNDLLDVGSGTVASGSFYETGTWTPVFSDAATGGNTATGTFTGHYSRVGNVVILSFRAIDINTAGMTAGNDLAIQSLPFVCNSNLEYYGTVTANQLAFTGFLTPYIPAGTDVIRIYETATTVARDFTIISDITSGTTDIIGSITYATTY